MATTREWTCSDGHRLAGDYFRAEAPQARAIIAPAMGVPRGFYKRFAAWLADHGIDVATFDYRDAPGTAMADWGRLDIEAVIDGCGDDLPLFLIGHSCGGQLTGLAPSAGRLHGLVWVAAQSGYWGQWSGRGRAGMWLLGHLLIPALAHGRTFPARRLGLFPVDLPATVIAQWGRWMRHPRYLFDPACGLDTEACRRLALPALVHGFDDDGYAPAAAIDALLREYSSLTATRRQWAARSQAIGHMGFFREPMRETLWQPTLEWLLAVAANGEPTCETTGTGQ